MADVYNLADIKDKIVDLYQAGKLVPGIGIQRFREGSQSDNLNYAVIWKTHKLCFSASYAKLYGPDSLSPTLPAQVIKEGAANMAAFVNTINTLITFEDPASGTSTTTIDDAYAELVEVENE